MGVGKFDPKIPLPDHGDVEIKGPFDPQDHRVNTATVVFLIVQGKERKDAEATAEAEDAEDANPVIIEGVGTWERGRDDDLWTGTVSRYGRRAKGGEGELHIGLARGIAHSVVSKPSDDPTGGGKKFDPPSIESLTWCADFHFV